MRGTPAVIPKNIFQVISSQACHGKDTKCFSHDVIFINCLSIFSDQVLESRIGTIVAPAFLKKWVNIVGKRNAF